MPAEILERLEPGLVGAVGDEKRQGLKAGEFARLTADQLEDPLRAEAEHPGRGADRADIDRAGNRRHGDRLSGIEEHEVGVEPLGREIALVLGEIDGGQPGRFKEADRDVLGAGARGQRRGEAGEKNDGGIIPGQPVWHGSFSRDSVAAIGSIAKSPGNRQTGRAMGRGRRRLAPQEEAR